MKKINIHYYILPFFAIFLTVTLSLTSCKNFKPNITISSGEAMDSVLYLKDFSAVKLLSSYDVIYKQGKDYGVKVTASKDVMDAMNVTVEDGVLCISSKEGISFSVNNVPTCVYVISPDLVGVTVKGSGSFFARTQVDTDKMSIMLTGSGDVTFDDIICDDFDVNVVGSGDVMASEVDCLSAVLNLRGSGDINVKSLRGRELSVSLYGSGDIKASCQNFEKADVNLTGSGDIRLIGSFRNIKKEKKGSGDITVGV